MREKGRFWPSRETQFVIGGAADVESEVPQPVLLALEDSPRALLVLVSRVRRLLASGRSSLLAEVDVAEDDDALFLPRRRSEAVQRAFEARRAPVAGSGDWSLFGRTTP